MMNYIDANIISEYWRILVMAIFAGMLLSCIPLLASKMSDVIFRFVQKLFFKPKPTEPEV